MSLYREIMYSTAPVFRRSNQFYGDYKELNSVSKPSSNEIAKLQESKLREFQKQAMKNDSKVQQLNNFLQSNGKFANSTNNEFDKIINEHIQELFNQINQLIGQGAMSKNYRDEIATNKQKEQDLVNKLTKLANKIKSLSKQIGQPINSRYIDELVRVVDDLPGVNLDFILRTLYHLKGDILEETGVNWLNERVPQDLKVRALNTGAVQTKKGQLIQDIMVLDVDMIDLMSNVEVSFSVEGKPQTLNLKNFLDKIESHKGSKNIVIEDESYALLQSLSLMGIQAKSGQNQLPWNVGSKNTWASIGEGQGGKCAQYITFLDRLQTLYNTWDTNHKNIKTRSDVYVAMANYNLASQLNKVLHLSQYDNQYVLTPNGFMTYADRILELYRKKGSGQYMFRFKGNIDMGKTPGDHIVTKSRPVIINGM